MAEQARFSHFDEAGNARMVDVGAKGETVRRAVAAGTVTMAPEAYRMVRSGSMAKGDVCSAWPASPASWRPNGWTS